MKIFSTFSGIGGFEIGIQNAYREAQRRSQANPTPYDETGQGLVASQRQGSGASNGRSSASAPDRPDQRPLFVGYSEIDKYAIKVYERNFTKHVCDRVEQTEQRAGTATGRSSLYSESRRIRNEESNCNCERPKNYGDITKINADELPDFDCLVGGFPCQAFSIAGKRKGFEDTRGTLFFDLARILRAKQPRLFVFENVKGLLSHDSGRTFKTIIQTIDELGYDCQWQVLNSKNHGVPQNRERVYIVGHLRGTPRPKVFPIGETNPTINEGLEQDNTKSEVASTVRSRYGNGTGSHISQLNNPTHSNNRKIVQPVLTPDRLEKRQNGRRFKEDGEPSFTLTSQDKHGVFDGAKIRRLTPTECERLQGFPDNWTAEGIDGAISDTQRYKMCGNAVTTNVVQAVFERLLS